MISVIGVQWSKLELVVADGQGLNPTPAANPLEAKMTLSLEFSRGPGYGHKPALAETR
jgi:hypothetical protein